MTEPITLAVPEEDAADLTDAEVMRAVDTLEPTQLARLILRAVLPEEGEAQYTVTKYEVRRRTPHLYLRTTLTCPGKCDRTLIHRIDWLQAARVET